MKTDLYRHYGEDGELLYVGVSLSAINRLAQHSDQSDWFARISRVTIEKFETREDALEAERRAIQTEGPLHNIQHKKSANQLRAEEKKEIERIAKASRDLTARVVNFRPVYSIKDAAFALGVGTVIVRKWMREGAIGYFTMPNTKGRMVEYISGWQIIEHIEAMMSNSER